jgi:signal transduction histidine kinase
LDGLERIKNIVRAMKEFSHPGDGDKEAIDLNHAIQNTLTVARNELKYVADVVTDFAPDLPRVPCFPQQFNQIVLNLAVNAAHAIAKKNGAQSAERGTITVQTRERGEMVEIRITDTGTGIPAAVQDKIFDPFFTTKEVGIE